MSSQSASVRRRSLEIPGITHGNAPIPMGARVGNMLFSSGIMGKNPANDTLPADAATQASFMFQNMKALLQEGGATLADVAFMRAYITDNAYRDFLNTEWLKCFPDAHDRPARHTHLTDLPGGILMQIEIVAVIPE